MLQMRDYQQDVIHSSQNVMRSGIRRFMICLPTGAGKTAISTHIIRESTARGHLSYFLCHRVELLEQTEDTFRKAGIDYGVIAADRSYIPGRSAYIGSIDTVRRRLDRIPTPDLAVIDEAAHCPAQTWKQVIDTWPQAWRIGLTATPQRLSGEGFTDIFDSLVLGPSTADLIAQGWLAPFRMYAPPGIDPSGLHTRAGDYITSEAEALVDKPHITGDVIEHYRRLSLRKRAIVFCVSVKHSENVAAKFNAAGIPARHVDGTTPAEVRRQAMADFRAGRVMVLCNCSLFLEGVDVPALETCILLRPTRSLALYLQAVGRALRPAPGKTALILDHVGAVQMHGMPDDHRIWTLAGITKRQRGDNDNEPGFSIRICEKCYAAFRPAPVCPYCGATAKPSKREIKIREGELAEISRLEAEQARKTTRKQQGMARTLQELQEIGRQKGYAPGWAYKVYSSRKR
jgi:superfamily II DNA or RNA helicase